MPCPLARRTPERGQEIHRREQEAAPADDDRRQAVGEQRRRSPTTTMLASDQRRRRGRHSRSCASRAARGAAVPSRAPRRSRRRNATARRAPSAACRGPRISGTSATTIGISRTDDSATAKAAARSADCRTGSRRPAPPCAGSAQTTPTMNTVCATASVRPALARPAKPTKALERIRPGIENAAPAPRRNQAPALGNNSGWLGRRRRALFARITRASGRVSDALKTPRWC